MTSAPGRNPVLIGRRYGDWRVLARAGLHRQRNCYLVECIRCGRRIRRHGEKLRTLPDRPCPCDRNQPEQDPPTLPIAVDHWTPWEDDDVCWYVTAVHPDGLDRRQVGELMGVTDGAVGVIELGALRKIAALAEQGNADALAMLRHLAEESPGDEDEGRPWPDWEV